MKKIISLFVLVAMIFCMSSCNGVSKINDTNDKDKIKSITESTSFTKDNSGNVALKSGKYLLSFVKESDGYSVSVVDENTGKTTFSSENPAIVKSRVGTNSADKSEKEYSSKYSSILKTDYGYYAEVDVSTDNGSVFTVSDSWYVRSEGVFSVLRNVKVKSAGQDKGFASIVSFASQNKSTNYKDFEYFLPSILYKDSSDMSSLAIGKNLNVNTLYVKETRMGLPMAMLKEINGDTLTLVHTDPEISVNDYSGDSYFVNENKLQYGSIGYRIKTGASVDFCYPSSEGPTTYDASSGWSKVYHEVTEGNSHSYTISLIPDDSEEFTDAMVYSYETAYNIENPYITDEIDIDEVYESSIEALKGEYRSYGDASFGFPWSIDLVGTISEGYTFQMGFVGMHTELGYQMLSYGYNNEDGSMIEKGNNILNMWSKFSYETNVPRVWIEPNSTSPSYFSNYPSFIRCFTDGMEGLLNGYITSKNHGDIHSDWLKTVVKVGDFLVDNQNDDGSYYRAYEPDGSVCVRENDSKQYQGQSKNNTTCAVRFLAKLYEVTKDERYKEAAISAADYCYENLYMNGKYAGGTPDNPNVVDKEAAAVALYCFNAAYQLTGEEKYLKAARHAAVTTMSWVYVYDFAVPNQPSGQDSNINPFSDGGVIGFSMIATGHSSADNYSAIMYYEFYKLYIMTGDEVYKDCALLLQQDTKLSSDYDGKLGYKYSCMCPEATVCADFQFKSVEVWLFWSCAANNLPISEMRAAFGNADISKIEMTVEELQLRLEEYGFGNESK